MRFVYCILGVYNPGGMERVLLNKVKWLVRHGHDVKIVTTDQQGRPPFYDFPKEVEFIDLNINYTSDNDKSPVGKTIGYLKKRRLHKSRLTNYLKKVNADFTISLYPCESGFIPDIADGSKKILELHFSKYFRLQYNRRGLLGVADKLRTRKDDALVRKFDAFIVLSEEDSLNWKYSDNISVIPNSIHSIPSNVSDLKHKRVIAVGRLDYQKGFDRLIDAWGIVMKKHPELRDWRLDIFGQGEWHDMLVGKIADLGLEDNAAINPPTNEIVEEYLKSSLLVMSSNYEGFGMVLVEAMTCGVPCVSFACPCGPRDIIEDGVNGLLVGNGDVEGLAEAMAKVMADDDMRRRMGLEARKVTERFSEEAVMKMWMDLFEGLR